MRTIGALLRETRVQKKYSRNKLEEITKIKSEFIEALEKEDWGRLPEYPVIQGFVRNLADALKLNQRNLIAILRRDYPPKTLRINPKPDISTKFLWSPSLTFLLGMILVGLMILGYLTFQYISFITPPKLTINSPTENQTVRERKLKVTGVVEPESSVLVNNQPALVDEDGNYLAEIEIFEGTKEIIVQATKRSGKVSLISRKIKTELDNE